MSRQCQIDEHGLCAYAPSNPYGYAPHKCTPRTPAAASLPAKSRFGPPQQGTIPDSLAHSDNQPDIAVGNSILDRSHVRPVTQSGNAPVENLSDPLLALSADVLDDMERVKIANQNRLRTLTQTGEDADGEERGFGLDESHPDVARLAALVAMLEVAEHDATLNLQRAMRRHPLGAFVKTHRGVGDKQLARLLAKIGDPYWNHADEKQRTVSALWAYCGLHVLPASQASSGIQDSFAGGSSSAGSDLSPVHDDTQIWVAGVAARRKKGVKSNWSQDAKMRSWLIIASCMKQLDWRCKGETGVANHIEGCGCSKYRIIIDTRRKHTAITHPDWTPGHSLNDGMRIASKALLKDLWIEARRIHDEQR